MAGRRSQSERLNGISAATEAAADEIIELQPQPVIVAAARLINLPTPSVCVVCADRWIAFTSRESSFGSPQVADQPTGERAITGSWVIDLAAAAASESDQVNLTEEA